MVDQPLAVIDIGSNSGRVVVVELNHGHLCTLADGRVPLRLAAELVGGRLGDDAIERAVAAVRDFAAIASGAGAAATIAVATSAVRESTNGGDLVVRVRRETGIDVEIISGDDEARFSFVGAVYGLAVDDGMLVDVGGGSVEITSFRDRALSRAWTLPLGALRLSQTFFEHDPPSGSEVRMLGEHVARTLREAGVPMLSVGEALVGTGGTVRALAKIDRRDRTWPIPTIHGYELSSARVAGWAEHLCGRGLAKRARMRGVNQDRADSIAAGALAMSAVIHHLGAGRIAVAGQGLREGIAYERLGAAVMRVEATREAAIAALASRFSTWRPDAASRRVEIAGRLRAALMPDATEGVCEMLRHAATLLDIGRAVRHYNAQQHAATLVLAADLTGFSHEHLALIACMLLAGGGDAKTFGRILSGPAAAQVPAAGCVLALAVEIERRLPPGHPGTVRVDAGGPTIRVRGPVPDGSWRESMSERTRAAFGRSVAIEEEAWR